MRDFNAHRKTNLLDSGFRRNDGRDPTGSRHAGLDKPAPAGSKPGASSHFFMERLYRDFGLEVARFDPDMEKVIRHPAFVRTGMPYENRPNIVGTLPGDDADPSIIHNGHIDVVSPEPVEAWQHDPWGAEIEFVFLKLFYISGILNTRSILNKSTIILYQIVQINPLFLNVISTSRSHVIKQTNSIQVEGMPLQPQRGRHRPVIENAVSGPMKTSFLCEGKVRVIGMIENCKKCRMLYLFVILFFLPTVALCQEEETYKFERMWPTRQQPWYFSYTHGIAIDKSGNVYVADAGNNRIQKFTSNGEFITKWGSMGFANGQFNSPKRIAIDQSGNVYVSDQGNFRIQKFTSDGTFITKWGSSGTGDGQFGTAAYVFDTGSGGIAIDDNGYVYVADRLNHRIQKFTSDGAFVLKWGSAGSAAGQFNKPFGIAVDKSGFVYVTDQENQRVQKFSQNGDFVAEWGYMGIGDGEFGMPSGISVDGDGNVYVLDTADGRIQKFTANGQFLAAFGEPGSEPGKISQASYLSVSLPYTLLIN